MLIKPNTYYRSCLYLYKDMYYTTANKYPIYKYKYLVSALYLSLAFKAH